MDIVMTLEKSANATAAVARGVRPEQFDSPTPCAEWNVEQLMNHLIGSLEYFKARGEGHQAGPPQSAPPTSYDQTVQALQSAATATAAAWQRPGALEQPIDTGAGQMPGSALATMALKPEARQPNFGPEAQAPSGAPPIDRLAAFLGRHP